LNPEGEAIKKLEGFRDAATLRRELDDIVSNGDSHAI